MITLATYKDHEDLIEIWEASLKSTHYFLYKDYVQEVKSIFVGIIQRLKVYAWRDSDGCIKAFTGVSAEKMELLFIHPTLNAENIRRQLINFCIHSLNVHQVDVTLEDPGAIGLYKNLEDRLSQRLVEPRV